MDKFPINMKNKNLILTALHGNEGFSIKPVKRALKKQLSSNFEMIIGNPRAYKRGVRFLEQDLNRIAPGKDSSPIYEQRRASELIKLSKNYNSILDIHGTNADTGIFIIITIPKIENIILAASLPIKNVVIWASTKSIKTGPITHHTFCPALEIECGPKNKLEIQNELETILEKILILQSSNINSILENASKQKFFQVYGNIQDVDTTLMKEFKKTTINGESFYPLLIDSYKKNSARKMRKIDFFKLLSYTNNLF